MRTARASARVRCRAHTSPATALSHCGRPATFLPCSAIQGLRAPFLEIKGEVWEILADNGFLYDRWVAAHSLDDPSMGMV